MNPVINNAQRSVPLSTYLMKLIFNSDSAIFHVMPPIDHQRTPLHSRPQQARTTAPWRRALSAAITLLLVCATTLLTPGGARAITFDSGHIDAFNVTATAEGGLLLNLKEDITGAHVAHAPESVVMYVSDDAYTDQTTNQPGIERPTWLLPQTQVSNLPWPGWDTNGVREGGFSAIDITLVTVEGPGTIFLYQQDTFGDLLSVTADGGLWLSSGSVIAQPQPAHVHANWAFDAPGIYTLTAVASGYNDRGQYVESNSATYTFDVGNGQAPELQTANDNADDASAAGTAQTNTAPGASSAAGAPGAPAGTAPSRPGVGQRAGAGSGADRSAAQDSRVAAPATAASQSASWAWWTWLLLALGVLALIGGGVFLYFQLKQERAGE